MTAMRMSQPGQALCFSSAAFSVSVMDGDSYVSLAYEPSLRIGVSKK